MAPTTWLTLLFGAAMLVGCGAEPDRYAPATDGAGSLPRSSTVTGTGRVLNGEPRRGDGSLVITARSSLQRQLGAIHYVVSNAAGDVVAGGDDEATSETAADHELELALPAGEGFRLELSATTTDAESSSCTASVGPFRIEKGTEASFQVFVWRCDGAPGAARPERECYWLADWVGVSRTRAAVGEVIGVSAAGHDASGEPARLTWSTPSPEQGRFEDAHAGETSFRCASPSVALPLAVAMNDGRCDKQFSALVSCQ